VNKSADQLAEFVTDGDPLDALARFVDLVTPQLAARGFTQEAQGRDWAHWISGFQNVIRAYAFRETRTAGIRVYRQGDIPSGLGKEITAHVVDATGWTAS